VRRSLSFKIRAVGISKVDCRTRSRYRKTEKTGSPEKNPERSSGNGKRRRGEGKRIKKMKRREKKRERGESA
jgi:hypothetical protein